MQHILWYCCDKCILYVILAQPYRAGLKESGTVLCVLLGMMLAQMHLAAAIAGNWVAQSQGKCKAFYYHQVRAAAAGGVPAMRSHMG